MSEDVILEVYAQGPAAVVALVQSLLAQVEQQRVEIAQLSARLQRLEERQARDSHNSSKPPSTDPPGKRTTSLRQPSGKSPGGQKGHEGHTLCQRPDPDTTVPHRPSHCSGCGTSLESGAVLHTQRRQVFDLPPLALEVVEHQALTVQCPHCQTLTTAPFPEGVTQPVQYGPYLRSLIVYLRVYQLVPYERLGELLEDLFGSAVSLGTLCQATAGCAQGLRQTEEQIKAGLRQAKVAHFDESGFRVGKQRYWLHVAATATLTHYGWHPTRGKEATDAMGILPLFGGRAVHDSWKPYFLYGGCQHALCNAHHLRELTFFWEEGRHAWARPLLRLLLGARARVERERGRGATALPAAKERLLVGRYHRLVEAGLAAHPPPQEPAGKKGRKKQGKERSFLLRLKERWQETLCFALDLSIPFDNNQAERDVRMLKVQQKISGCFRSEEGATQFCRIRSYISTMRKQGHHVLEVLRSVFLGCPLQPCLQA
jgi:transposase